MVLKFFKFPCLLIMGIVFVSIFLGLEINFTNLRGVLRCGALVDFYHLTLVLNIIDSWVHIGISESAVQVLKLIYIFRFLCSHRFVYLVFKTVYFSSLVIRSSCIIFHWQLKLITLSNVKEIVSCVSFVFQVYLADFFRI